MPLEIAVGPQRLVLNQGNSFMVTEQDGEIAWPTDQGLYFADTRLLSSWRIYANGEKWDLLNGGNTAYYAARIYLSNRAMRDGARRHPGRHPQPHRSAVRWSAACTRTSTSATTAARPCSSTSKIAARSDFADLFEVKSDHIVRRGRIVTEWSQRHQQLRVSYENDGFKRGLTIRVRRADLEGGVCQRPHHASR